MEQVNYEKLLPTAPPDEMLSWLFKQGFFKSEYIVYRAAWVTDPLSGIKERMVHCTCSCCESEWYEPRVNSGGCSRAYAPASFGFHNSRYYEDVISGQVTICPFCEVEAQALHTGNIRDTKVVDEIYPLTVERICGGQGVDRIALITWRIVRSLNKYGHYFFTKQPYEAYVCEDRKIVRLTGYYSGMFGRKSYFDSWEQKKQFLDSFGKVGSCLIYPFEPDILIGTSMENSKLDMYVKCDKTIVPITYCNLYLKHKNVENLIVQGMDFYINDILLRLASNYYCCFVESITHIKNINWKEKKPHRMLGLTNDEFKYAKSHNWKDDYLSFYRIMKSSGVRPEDVGKCYSYGLYLVKDFALDHPSENIMKVLRYLDRQRKKYPRQRKAQISDLRDYWNMLPQLVEDLYDNDILYPQNLLRAHDDAAERLKDKDNSIFNEAFTRRFFSLLRYEYVYNGLFIRPAHSPKELRLEGKNLSHCVGSYAQSVANGSTAIFFIRHVSYPDASYFTLELDEKRLVVRQNRGLRNCDRTGEVVEFEEKWLEHIRNISEKEKKKNGKQRNNAKSTAA